MLTLENKFNLVRWTFILISIYYIVRVAISYIRTKGLPLILKLASIPVFFGMASFADMYWIEPYWIRIERVVIKDLELATVLAGIKMIQISDIHIGNGIGYRERQLIEKVNELKPDILFITGDFFSIATGPDAAVQLKAISGLISSLKASVGIFGVLGNYDGYLSSNPERLQAMKRAGIDILVNESRRILLPNGQVLWLAGLHETSSAQNQGDMSYVYRTLEIIPDNSPVILLNHYPDIFGKASTAGVNLVLAGHTHGGQIGLPFLIHMSNSANKSPFMRGLFYSGKTTMYVNRGIGTTNIPVRYLCSPEITVFEFVGKPERLS